MIKLKEILQLNELKPMSGKPEKGDFVRDGKDFGKITGIYKGEAFVEPIPKQKGVTWLYSIKYLKMSKRNGQIERNVGKPIWKKGR